MTPPQVTPAAPRLLLPHTLDDEELPLLALPSMTFAHPEAEGLGGVHNADRENETVAGDDRAMGKMSSSKGVPGSFPQTPKRVDELEEPERPSGNPELQTHPGCSGESAGTHEATAADTGTPVGDDPLARHHTDEPSESQRGRSPTPPPGDQPEGEAQSASGGRPSPATTPSGSPAARVSPAGTASPEQEQVPEQLLLTPQQTGHSEPGVQDAEVVANRGESDTDNGLVTARTRLAERSDMTAGGVEKQRTLYPTRISINNKKYFPDRTLPIEETDGESARAEEVEVEPQPPLPKPQARERSTSKKQRIRREARERAEARDERERQEDRRWLEISADLRRKRKEGRKEATTRQKSVRVGQTKHQHFEWESDKQGSGSEFDKILSKFGSETEHLPTSAKPCFPT
ncbi:hypothetical protein FRC10_005222, partial [Ceratobasidium sp. 414]